MLQFFTRSVPYRCNATLWARRLTWQLQGMRVSQHRFSSMPVGSGHDDAKKRDRILDTWRKQLWDGAKHDESPFLTREVLEPMLSKPADYLASIEQRHFSPHLTMTLIGGDVVPWLRNISYNPRDQPDRFFRDVVHQGFRDARGYVSGLDEQKLDKLIVSERLLRHEGSNADQWSSQFHEKLDHARNLLFPPEKRITASISECGLRGIPLLKTPLFSNCAEHMTNLIEGKEIGGLDKVPHVLAVHPFIEAISSIDPVKQCFTVKGLMLMKWYVANLASDDRRNQRVSAGTVILPRFPELHNSIGKLEVDEPEYVTLRRHDHDGKGVVHASWKWSATVQEPFQLQDFPFDYQDLHLSWWFLGPGSPSSEDYGLLILPYRCGLYMHHKNAGDKQLVEGKAYAAAAMDLGEWVGYEPRVQLHGRRSSGHGASAGPEQQALVIELPLRRRHRYYVNLMMFSGFLATLGFMAFSIDLQSTSDRLEFFAALLFTTIGFRLSVAGTLPKIAYATQFDRYMSSCFFLLFAFMLESVFAKLDFLGYAEDALAMEREVCVPCLGLIWLVWHCLLVVRYSCHAHRTVLALGPKLPGNLQMRRVSTIGFWPKWKE